MKRSIPSWTLVVLAGVLIVALAIVLTRFFHPLVSFFDEMMIKANIRNSRFFLYAGAILIPIIAGVLMSIVIILVTKKDDREYDEALNAMQDVSRPMYQDIDRSLDSMQNSILRLRDASEIMKRHAGELGRLRRQMEDMAPRPAEAEAVAVVEPETCSATLANNMVEDLRVLHPVEALTPQELAPLPESHQMKWFFPHK
jgi:hypothetical protein